jgi:hypothetical protein
LISFFFFLIAINFIVFRSLLQCVCSSRVLSSISVSCSFWCVFLHVVFRLLCSFVALFCFSFHFGNRALCYSSVMLFALFGVDFAAPFSKAVFILFLLLYSLFSYRRTLLIWFIMEFKIELLCVNWSSIIYVYMSHLPVFFMSSFLYSICIDSRVYESSLTTLI